MGSIAIRKISITALDTDAIVNAANSGLWAGGGVCGAIFAAAGHDRLQEACSRIGYCPEGSAVITPGFALKARYIIHAVGPQWAGGAHREPQLLYGAYQSALELALESDCRSIAFPLISAGVFGYPADKAWRTAILACRDFLDLHPEVQMAIVFAVIDDVVFSMGQQILSDLAADLTHSSSGGSSVRPAGHAEDLPFPARSEALYLEGEGERIEGILYLPELGTDVYPTVILCHGFGCNYHFLTERIARELAQHGYAAYAFNLRNPDTRSMRNTSPLTEAKTLNIVIDQIKRQPFTDASRLYLLGESQGGFVSAYVAAKRAAEQDDIRALILYYPAFVLQDDARARNPRYQEEGYVYPETETVGGNEISGMYSRDALSFDIYEAISAYPRDVLIVHGTEDTVVPLAYSERAVKAYPHAELRIIQGVGHGFYGGEDFAAALEQSIAFLDAHREDGR